MRARRPAALVAAIAAAASAQLLAASPAGAGEPLRLTIAFTGDVSGYLEPCG